MTSGSMRAGENEVVAQETLMQVRRDGMVLGAVSRSEMMCSQSQPSEFCSEREARENRTP